MAQAANTTRVTVTIPNDLHQQLQYWAKKEGISINQFLYDSLELMIETKNRDYSNIREDIITYRINQIIEILQNLSGDVRNNTEITSAGFGSLLQLTRGDNYLLNNMDGDGFK